MSESGRSGEGEDAVDEERPIFSLVSGSYRHAKRYGERECIFFSHSFRTDQVAVANVEVPSDEQTKQKSTALARISPEKSLSKMSDSAAGEPLRCFSCMKTDWNICSSIPARKNISRVRPSVRPRCAERVRAREKWYC